MWSWLHWTHTMRQPEKVTAQGWSSLEVLTEVMRTTKIWKYREVCANFHVTQPQ
uniref:Uncharacterized protein n=1 Tax=Anguilla anguilla TaxID=7936 RepID=A0A0E9VEV3_ANGAN